MPWKRAPECQHAGGVCARFMSQAGCVNERTTAGRPSRANLLAGSDIGSRQQAVTNHVKNCWSPGSRSRHNLEVLTAAEAAAAIAMTIRRTRRTTADYKAASLIM